MAKSVVIDELHLTIRVHADLPDADADAVRTVLTGAEFMTRLGGRSGIRSWRSRSCPPAGRR